MDYKIVFLNELYHHGVKGMKWGVRKADYNTPGQKSSDIYKRIDDLGAQERRAKIKNFTDARAKWKSYKQDLKAQKKEKTITRAEYTAKKREGMAAAVEVFRKNNNKIHANFSQAYYDQISAGEIATARNKNRIAKMWDFSGDAETTIDYNNSRLDKAEARRDEFARDYAMRNYKPKKNK